MLSNIDRKISADRILYEYGLMKKLEEIGKSLVLCQVLAQIKMGDFSC